MQKWRNGPRGANNTKGVSKAETTRPNPLSTLSLSFEPENACAMYKLVTPAYVLKNKILQHESYSSSSHDSNGHSPFIWLITRSESPNTLKNLILRSIAAWRPIMHASYSAMLLVQLKHSRAVSGVWVPLGDMITAPIPLPKAFEAPSKCHVAVRLNHGYAYKECHCWWRISPRTSS